MIQSICKNCGASFSGKFCNACGEKVYADHDKSIRHFLDEGFHFFTHLDNKFFKTLATIFRRPGLLSLTYCEGARSKYFKPVPLFFIGVILYLIFPLLPGLNMSFENNLVNLKSQGMGFIAQMAYAKSGAKSITLDELGAVYDRRSPAFAKILLLIILPLTGLALKAMFPKRKKYFFDYLILGTEASCVVLYLNFFILPLLLFIPSWILNATNITTVEFLGDEFTLPVYAIVLVCWSAIAFKRFFKISFSTALAKGVLFLFLQSVLIFIIYRLILFLIVLLFI